MELFCDQKSKEEPLLLRRKQYNLGRYHSTIPRVGFAQSCLASLVLAAFVQNIMNDSRATLPSPILSNQRGVEDLNQNDPSL